MCLWSKLDLLGKIIRVLGLEEIILVRKEI